MNEKQPLEIPVVDKIPSDFIHDSEWPMQDVVLESEGVPSPYPEEGQLPNPGNPRVSEWPRDSYSESKHVESPNLYINNNGQEVARYTVEGTRDAKWGKKSGMSISARAWDNKLKRMVYLKFLDISAMDETEKIKLKIAFNREAIMTNRVKDTVDVLDYFETSMFPNRFKSNPVSTEPTPVIVMEYIPPEEARPLHEIIDELEANENLSIETALNVIFDVAGSLDQNANRFGRPLIHKDLKPSNIFATEEGRAKLFDYGTAHDILDNPEGYAIGTPSYMAPEQARDLDLDPRADIYSLGVVALELITKVNLHLGDSLYKPDADAVMNKAARQKNAFEIAEYLQKRFPIIPNRSGNGDSQYKERQILTLVFVKVLTSDLSKRYKTATDFALELEVALQPFIASESAADQKRSA